MDAPALPTGVRLTIDSLCGGKDFQNRRRLAGVFFRNPENAIAPKQRHG